MSAAAGKVPLTNKPDKTNWVEKAGGLPPYIKRIAEHLKAKPDFNDSRAIAVAVNVVKRMCATGDVNFPGAQQVNGKSRAEACKAVAEWNAKRGKSKIQEAYDATGDDELRVALVLLEAGGLTRRDREALAGVPLVTFANVTIMEADARPLTGGQSLSDRARPMARRRATHPRGTTPPRHPTQAKDGEFERKHPRGPGGKWKTVGQGASGDQVRAVQRRVGAAVDGTFGEKTAALVRAFQRKHGLVVDGIVGRQTAAAMRGDGNAKNMATGSLTEADRRYLARTASKPRPTSTRRKTT